MNFPLDTNNDQATSLSPLDHEERIVVLQPVTIQIFDGQNIYSPSKLRPIKELPYSEFLEKYADQPNLVRVCFEKTSCSDTLFQNSEVVTAYGVGTDCWYIDITALNHNND
ncbi:MAG: hypothetical protein H6631_10300 [Anaerolineaceae bacterium]|nr:hypothetical protein [Anaerolineaceae bacterium]MCB9100771.1 hypothetical protein [Anaerolineales bacterium]